MALKKTLITAHLILLSLLALSCRRKAVTGSPNLIVIMCDDLGYADVGFNGCTDIPTPNIDRIANEGIRFSNGYVTYSVCSPSRAGFITGRYGQRFGYERNAQYQPGDSLMGLPLDEKTLAEVLAASAYTSGIIGKWHLGAHISNHPLNRGFDEFYGHLGGGHTYFPENLTIEDSYSINTERESYRTYIMHNHEAVKTTGYLTDEFSLQALRFVEKHREEAFFLYLSYNAPHGPLEATEKYLSRFSNIKDEKRRIYAAMVSAVDDGVGALLDSLEAFGLEENTIVVFLSDNGGPETKNASDNGLLREGKGSVYEGGFHVPFAMKWDGVLSPGVYEHPVSSLDIFASITSLNRTPLNPEKPLDGINLIPFLTGEDHSLPHEAIYLRKYDDKKFAVRAGDYKIVTHDNADIKELYNLEDDIGETIDLAEVYPRKLEELDSIRKAWNEELIPPAFLGLIHRDTWGWKKRTNEIYKVK
ncbi:MAG: sulfatase-like hydrolase/transferase [Bacteroidetes bacterium]|nr:sulfatase-like hydrolase/transferase [Bacteroidota bacterium]